MNFERLRHKLKQSTHCDDKKLYVYLIKSKINYINKQKLKLGSIAFDIKEHIILGFKLYETTDIRFTRQDNTFENSIKIDNRLQSLKWKWDFSNILSFLIITSIFLLLVYFQILCWYQENFSSLDYSNYRSNVLLKQTFTLLFENLKMDFKSHMFNANTQINDILINFCDRYNILK